MAISKNEQKFRAGLKLMAAVCAIGLGGAAFVWPFVTLGLSQSADDNFGVAINHAASAYDSSNMRCESTDYTLSNLPSDLLSPDCLWGATLASCVLNLAGAVDENCRAACDAMTKARKACSQINWNFFDVNSPWMPITTMGLTIMLGAIFLVYGGALARNASKQWVDANREESAAPLLA